LTISSTEETLRNWQWYDTLHGHVTAVLTLSTTGSNLTGQTGLFFFCNLTPANTKPIMAWGPFLESPDNFPAPKTILGAQYSPVAIQFFLILKAKF